MKRASDDAGFSGTPTEAKFEQRDVALHGQAVKTAFSVPRSPLFETAEQLNRLSRDLRLYVAGFELFRDAKDNCDVLCEELRETRSDYGYWEKISRWMAMASPASLDQLAGDDAWPADLGRHVKQFKKTHSTARKRIQQRLTGIGAASGGPSPSGADDDEALRADARGMRDIIGDALRISGQRADRLAGDIRTCVETLSVLLPTETQEASIDSDVSIEHKLRGTKEEPLDDRSSVQKDVSKAAGGGHPQVL